MLPGSMVCVDLPAFVPDLVLVLVLVLGLLTAGPSVVASKRLRVLHIRLNLPEN